MKEAKLIVLAAGILWAALVPACFAGAQHGYEPPSGTKSSGVEVHLRLSWPLGAKARSVPAVLWLEPLGGTPVTPFASNERYTLLQKNRMFSPHLLVVPVGASVQFPNKDPFFHNVFSLFDGKRFDLGLYEAGTSKSVNFSREGVSYIFCNIHPEMSAVVVSLATSLFAVADKSDAFVLSGIPPGDYRLHFWIEGVPLSSMDTISRAVHFSAGTIDMGTVSVPESTARTSPHANKYGQPYEPTSKPPYE